ncbi:MPE1 [Candida oxycetoniae]|uniref:MPE1 n=1 Tax=Candida oxycetoniae TaxID=497107 RepID=A0AAI9WVV4_9ASCO|nr:MPE1 [Candida oxycetoniae]KAI3402620.2 MPE1 [Candida oxycetoniae]
MSSVVYYKFLHQKNKNVIHFDGTGISVFDLKREIIQQNHLGAGTDFNIKLYHSEQPEIEYELDNDVISRSSYVLAKRSPASARMGKFNNASRYITGKPRLNRKMINSTNNANVTAMSMAAATGTGSVVSVGGAEAGITEEEKIKLMFENQSSAWAHTQDELAQHKMVYYKPTTTTATTAGNEDKPPPGYICYRCGKKDHWIKNCPTNNDPNFEGKKIMRTTGIPKSYLKTLTKEEVEKNFGSITNSSGSGDGMEKEGNAVLITDEGEYAIALADSKTWMSYQEKLQNAAMKSKQEYDSRLVGLAQQENKWEFIDPLSQTKRVLQPPIYMTPCCTDASKLKAMKNFNYNQEGLETLLIENDFHCPNCNKEDIYIDSLVRNEELENKINQFVESKEKELGLKDPSKRSFKDVLGNDPTAADDGPDVKKQKL